jgi:hypothetical protein
MRYFEDLKIERKKSIYVAISASTFLFTIYVLLAQPTSVFAQNQQVLAIKQR